MLLALASALVYEAQGTHSGPLRRRVASVTGYADASTAVRGSPSTAAGVICMGKVAEALLQAH
jgi:hypothetical protein